MDTARLCALMTIVERVTEEVPTLYRVRGASALDTGRAVLPLLRKAAHALAEACAIAAEDPPTFAKLDELRMQAVKWLVECARTCMALEEAELLAEAEGQTLH